MTDPTPISSGPPDPSSSSSSSRLGQTGLSSLVTDQVIKWMRIDRQVSRNFSALCIALGLKQTEVMQGLIAKWVRENESQSKISSFLKPQQIVNIRADNVQLVSQRADVVVLKAELGRIVKILEKSPAEPILFNEQLAKALRRAAKLPVHARDPALQRLIQRAEELVK